MKRLLGLPGVRSLMRWCALLAAGAFVLILVQWVMVARIVDGVFLNGKPPDVLWTFFVWLAAAWVGRAALLGVRDWLSACRAAGVKRTMRARLVEKLFRLGPSFTARERGGELTETVVAGPEKLEPFVARFVPGLVFACVIPPLVAVTALVLDPLSGLILVVTGPVVVLLLWLVGTLADQAAREQWLLLGRLGAGFVDTLRVLPTLLVFGHARRRLQHLNELDDAYRRTTLRVLRTAFLSGAVLELGATLSTALVAVTVGVRLYEGHLPFERALLVLLLTPEYFAPLRTLGGDHHASLEARAAGQRLFSVLDAPTPRRGNRPVPLAPLEVELRDVTLDYAQRPALDRVSVRLPARTSTVLVGESGAGKSSLARLVLGFEQATRGEVLINGVPLCDLDEEAWLSCVAYLPERPYLFSGSVRDNIALGRDGVTPEQITAAAQKADAHDFITRLPHGYDTEIGEDGARLSGGERVRLAIARAFLKDAPLLILDEPTAQLDSESEALVRSALRRLQHGRTVLVITHRQAVQEGHDQVLRLQGGRLEAAFPATPAVTEVT